MKFPINDHFGFRAQGRMMGTVIASDSNLWCSSGRCAITISEVTGPIQGDLMAGIYVAF